MGLDLLNFDTSSKCGKWMLSIWNFFTKNSAKRTLKIEMKQLRKCVLRKWNIGSNLLQMKYLNTLC